MYAIRPLFFPQPEEAHEKLDRAMTKLSRKLRRLLNGLGRDMRRDELARYTFCPNVSEHRLDLTIALRKRTATCRFLFVSFQGLGVRLAFTPSLPDLWFTLEKGQTLRDRTTEVFTNYFREREKEEGDNAAKPELSAIQGKAWTTTLDLDIFPAQAPPPSKQESFAFLGGQETFDGADELDRVGRCLDWLFPDELDRVIFRAEEMAELEKLLDGTDKRPLLLLGARGVGKTAIIHEYIYRSVETRGHRYSSKRNVWLLSPQRLISGMSFVGQWENRLLAILNEAKKRRHILYFDDILGLYRAGISRESQLSVAHVLKPHVERQAVRILGEMTHEAFRVFQEADRGFADLFHILPVREPTEDETLQILFHVMRQLEGQHRCRFALDVLPTVLDLQRRYVRDVAFPGKAATFLRQLAVKYRNADVKRETVLQEFHGKSGLAISFLDDRAKLDRRDVAAALNRELIGQDRAIQAAADVVCIAKARMNDPTRPLASFLFLGPTGVGKTQCAKTLAAYLFGDAEKLLRFDMNEYVEPTSVARLVGSFEQPEGLLTSAVRRRPFSLILLDEIEKADPDVFDLLLQVMGEGRLTDALGRTVDFTNAILILTSNLGVREAGAKVGFRQEESKDDAIYIQAAEGFFRPEFFNRLDRVVPFERLRRDDVQQIARLLIQGVFEREGLMRRKCVLQVDPMAMERVVDEGYHPLLGARALKRAIERNLTQTAASYLASMTPETPTVVSLLPAGKSIAVQVQGLVNAEHATLSIASVDTSDPESVLRRVTAAVERVEGEIEHLRPHGAIASEAVTPEHYRYFAIREQTRRVRNITRRMADQIAIQKRPSASPMGLSPSGRRRKLLKIGTARDRRIWQEIFAADDIHTFLMELVSGSDPKEAAIEERLNALLRETALLHIMAEDEKGGCAERVLVHIRALDKFSGGELCLLRDSYEKLFRDRLRLDVTIPENIREIIALDTELLLVEGLKALTLVQIEEGTHLFCPSHGSLVPIQVMAIPVPAEEDEISVFRSHLDKRRNWLDLLSDGKASVDDDPFPSRPVIRVYDAGGMTLDVRTGLLTTGIPSIGEFRVFLLSQLPLPDELC